MIHLDTSFLIRALVAGSLEDTRLREWLAADEALCMSTIAWAELLCGPLSEETEALAVEIVTHRESFGDKHANLAARLFNDSGRRRGTLVDCMVAATALENSAPIATTNEADFRRFEGFGLVVLAPVDLDRA